MHSLRYFAKKRILTAAIAATFSLVSSVHATPEAHASSASDIFKPAYNCDNDLTFSNRKKTVRFINQATFGATYRDITQLTNTCASRWFLAQLNHEPSLLLPTLDKYTPDLDNQEEEQEFTALYLEAATHAFWKNSITGDDQLRQRVAFALSEILVVSNGGGEFLTDQPAAVTAYQEMLVKNAFGNYFDILKHVTYSPAMGHYLTYMGSEKGDDATGRKPDENYARELLQLFTIGVVALNPDGTPKLDEHDKPIETYTNMDVQGLARVFTGLNLDEEIGENQSYTEALKAPMAIFPESHSQKEKTFLNYTIPENTDAATSIDLALTHIFNHPNVGPFIGQQLIQRLVSSNPSRSYIARVTRAFNNGKYILPNGKSVGTNRRGDMTATIAAVLFAPEARSRSRQTDGKVREPIIRFTQWARAFDVQNIQSEFVWQLWDTSAATSLAQHPYRASSVFNFFRPGYQAPGSITGEKNLKAPELQITNSTSIPSYINFMTYFIMGEQQEIDVEELRDEFGELRIDLNPDDAPNAFYTNYEREIGLADDPLALMHHLDVLLTGGTMSRETKRRIAEALGVIRFEEPEETRLARVRLALLLTFSAADYLVQK